MASVLLLSHPAKGTQEKFYNGLKDVVDSKSGFSDWVSILPELDASKVKQCVVGPNHLAFLMQDGRVCRVAFHTSNESSKFHAQKEPSSDDDPSPSSTGKTPATPSNSNLGGETSTRTENSFRLSGETLSSLSGQLGRWATQRVSSNATSTSSTTTLASRVASTRGRGRIIRATRGRIGAGWLSGRAVIPASAVPEELIVQAQIVLQGKSRQVIIRELQKTSLDVNLAVNNLLSRDDDDPDEPEDDTYIQEAYLPNDELMSLFEAGIPSEEPFVVQRDSLFPEDILLNPLYTRAESRTTNRQNVQNEENSSSTGQEDREFSSSRIRDRWWGMIIKNDSKERATTSSLKNNNQSKPPKQSVSVETTHRFGEVEWWRFKDESEDSIKFSQIAALHSELMAVTENGFLHQWRWSEAHSPITEIIGHVHSRAPSMGILNCEKITKIAACNVRVSVLTESGKIATWFDETLSVVSHKLEQPLQHFSEFKNHSVTKLHVCDLYTCVQLANGPLLWWGVFPFEQRKKILDRVKMKAKKSAISGSSLIKIGTQVCIRSCPLYYPGAIGFTTINGEPKVGELLEQAWSIVEKCRFKIIETFSEDVTNENIVEEEEEDDGPHRKKMKRSDGGVDVPVTSLPQMEEKWCLKDVIFVEEVRNVPVGSVLKVDGAYALVDFSSRNANGRDLDSVLADCRLVRKDELQIVKWTTPPKMPECFQKRPKQLILSANSKVLAMVLDSKGVQVLLKSLSGLRYVTFSLATGRVEAGGMIQSEPASFLSRSSPHTAMLHSSGLDSLTLLQDPNQCLYPLIKDNISGIRNPALLNLCPISCVGMGRKNLGDSNKSPLVVTVMVVKECPLIQSILRCDFESIHQILVNLKQEDVDDFIKQKVDGNRNILHLCVATCKPTANKSNKRSQNKDEGKSDIYDMWTPLFDGESCLEVLLTNIVLAPHMFGLLAEKDSLGCTPFMSAVRLRAYSAAVKLYNTIVDIRKIESPPNKTKFMEMICPAGTDPDISPLQVLCCNDTCSFTWTGTKHINQDIFECKTCGLVGPLCCCTECAQVCHVGHECKLKKTSPTAYCDCWEKYPCKSLIPGDQTARIQLLHKLVDDTELCTLPNKRGQHILLFLVQTVARQSNEQAQYIPNRNTSTDPSKSLGVRRVRSQTPPPDNELEPPKFAKTTLLYLLRNWLAVKSLVLFGCNATGHKRAQQLDDNIIVSSMLQPDEIEKCLDAQTGTSMLDNFVHKLIIKCNLEFLETLLQLFQRCLEENNRSSEMLNVVNRFIRSVIRVYVIFMSCTPNNVKRKGILKCKRVFVSLNVYAAKQLASTANSIFSPVRLGVAFPSAPFTLGTGVEGTTNSETLFSVLPMPGRSENSSTVPSRVRFADIVSEANEGTEDLEESQSQLSAGNDETSYMDLVETDSDSDESNNGETAETQSTEAASDTIGRRRLGSLTDRYFSTTEISETEGEEEEDNEDEDEDDDDTEAIETERSTTAPESNNTTPRVLQWAVRDNTSTSATPSTSSNAHVVSSGVMFMDATRRSAASSSGDTTSMNLFSTSSALARTFGILVREVADLLSLTANDCSFSGVCLLIDPETSKQARLEADRHLNETWLWLWKVLELTEAQLRFGASLTAVSDPLHSQHPLHESQSAPKVSRSNAPTNILSAWSDSRRKKRGNAASTTTPDTSGSRQNFLCYILSLMRSNDNEHGDSLPKLDITALRHLAYILDSFIYYLRSSQEDALVKKSAAHETKTFTKGKEEKKKSNKSSSSALKSSEEEDDESENTDCEDVTSEIDQKAALHRFFKRSDSTLVLGYAPADSFSPLKEALPLAEKPQLLNPSARRDQFFGVKKTTNDKSCPEPTMSMKLGNGEECSMDLLRMPANVYLGRWHLCLELFGRLFLDDVGAEPHSILNELGRFDVKEVKFKREMEKLKNGHQKDLYLEGLERTRNELLQQSLRQLNSQFGRRLPGAGPLNIHRMKVSFKNEQGEGSGVVRSFYTAISDALLADENLPNLDNIFSGSRGLTHQLRARAREREREFKRSSTLGLAMVPRTVRRNYNERTEINSVPLSVHASPYVPDESSPLEDSREIPVHKRELGRRLYNRINALWPDHAPKVTGMILELTPTQIIHVLTSSEDVLSNKVKEALDLIAGKPSCSKEASPSKQLSAEDFEEEEIIDNSPLFFQPGKPGFYSPRPGQNVLERLNCFRNVGRIVGLCLLQNELCPMFFNRHVIKYLLGRKISWHDLAFFDPTLYESLRQLIQDSKREDAEHFFSDLDLTYCIQLRDEEGGGSVELVKGGTQVEVAPGNVHDYVKRYAEYRMVVNSKSSLQAMRRGLLDVIPASHLENLTAEDFRLLLNGTGGINIQQLMSYTFFSDETGGEGLERLTKFKKWFWCTVENMTPKQKQDLLYFWTSSPAMPASAEGFQPMPSVTVKPANDHQLPTANTCISRLYVPLYSSKAILKSKFLLAIKTKVFGFV